MRRIIVMLLALLSVPAFAASFSTAVPLVDISAGNLSAGTLTSGWPNNGSLGGKFARDWGVDPVVADVVGGSNTFKAVTFNNNTRLKLVDGSGNKIDAAVSAPGIIGNATNYPASNPNYTVVYWAYKTVNNDSASSICALGPQHKCTFQYGGSWQIEQWTSFGSYGVWGDQDWNTVAPAGLWHQVVVTNFERVQKMYYDGVLKYTKTHLDGNYLDTFGLGAGNPITVGASYWEDGGYNGPNPPLRGSIAGLRIYDVACSESEAIALFTTYRPGAGVNYTITASAGTGGTISPSGSVSVNSSSSQTFTITPNVGYAISSVTVDGVSQGAVASYTFTNVTANHTISAAFVAVPTFTITVSAGANGSISPSGSVVVNSGMSKSFTVTANTGFVISSVTVDGVNQSAISSYTFNNITANHTISATFAPAPTYTIAASAGANGSITPSGSVSVTSGGSKTFSLAANAGYVVDIVTVDGVSQGALSSYTFSNVTANHTISATFQVDTSPGRLAYYTFDATTGTAAVDSWGSYTGTLTGGCTWVSGKVGNAVNLDGSSGYVRLPNNLTTTLNDFTIATWVKLDTNNGWNRIFDFGSGTATNMFLTPSAGGGAMRFAIKLNNGSEQQLNAPSALPVGTWQHVAVTLSGTTGKLYLNGVAIATNTSMTLKPSSLGALTQTWIGRSQFNDPYFDGLVDDFKIYSKALTASEVMLVYNPTLTSYTITASAGVGGSISPSGSVAVIGGTNQIFTITPAPVYTIDQVLVDGDPVVPAPASYTFNNVTANGHSIAVTFKDSSVPVADLAALKLKANTGQTVRLTGSVTVTAVSSGTFFVGERSYKGCIRVIGNDAVTPGNYIKNLVGIVTKDAFGQYTITLSAPVSISTTGNVIKSVGANNKSCVTDPKLLTNLVKVWGKVGDNGFDYTIADGYRSPLTVKVGSAMLSPGPASLKGVLWKETNGSISLVTSGEPVGYVYSSFTGDGEDGLHLLTSMDGKSWQTVKNYASIYQQSSGLMRDPCICLGGDGKYHLVWTTGWWDDTIGIAHSNDLITWTPSKKLYVWADYPSVGQEESDGVGWPSDLSVPITRNAKVRNCWAPDMFYDQQTKEYVIFWATTIDDATVFPQTWDANRWERMNQRIYYITTKDFVTYTPRKFFYAPSNRVVIDACMTKVAVGDYRMIVKDELAQSIHICTPTKPLTTWAQKPANFWSTMSTAFTGPGIEPDNTNAEGPSVIRAGSDWLVYCDYWLAGKNGLFSTKDFITMTRINDQFSAPTWVRHGTAFKAPKAIVDSLNALR